jgi:hypothetical protein
VVAYAKANDIDLKSKGAYGIGDFVDKFDDMEAGDFKTKPGPDKWDFNKKIRLHFMLVSRYPSPLSSQFKTFTSR